MGNYFFCFFSEIVKKDSLGLNNQTKKNKLEDNKYLSLWFTKKKKMEGFELIQNYIDTVLSCLKITIDVELMKEFSCGWTSDETTISIRPNMNVFRKAKWNYWQSHEKNEESDDEIPVSFYHFTSIKSIVSMIQDEKIRLYALDSKNDPSELLFIGKLLNYNNDDGWIEKLKDKRKQFYSLSLIKEDKENNVDPILWELYGNNGQGVKIEFEVCRLSPRDEYYMLDYIEYENELNFRHRIDAFLNAHENFKKAHEFEFEADTALCTFASLIKNEYYKMEKEYRLLHYNSIHPERFYADILYNYDEKDGKLVNYHTIQLAPPAINPEIKTPYIKLKSIELGPKVDKQWQSHLRRILIRKKWKDIKVIENKYSHLFKID